MIKEHACQSNPSTEQHSNDDSANDSIEEYEHLDDSTVCVTNELSGTCNHLSKYLD